MPEYTLLDKQIESQNARGIRTDLKLFESRRENDEGRHVQNKNFNDEQVDWNGIVRIELEYDGAE